MTNVGKIARIQWSLPGAQANPDFDREVLSAGVTSRLSFIHEIATSQPVNLATASS
ncbi:hypothetical protein [Roseibium sp.]|uniref:hypothetical protein n=1 Tax=Roseibium sp. TaxID=1936156 RepID=UPI0039F0D27C